MKSITEALQNTEIVTELILTKEDILNNLPPEISTLTNLKKLEITGNQDGTLAFPRALLQLPIEDLMLHHFRAHEAFELKHLKKLSLYSHYTQEDILPICRNLKQLTHLNISTCYSKPIRPLVIPKQISKLINLEELRCNGFGMTSLPEELAELPKLRSLFFINQEFSDFPLVITKLKKLQKLQLSKCQLTCLPKEFQYLQQLKSLDISQNFQLKFETFEEEMEAMFGDEDENHKPKGFVLPEVLATLVNLERLDLQFSDFVSIEALTNLKNLKYLNLSHGLASNKIEVLSSLTNLEELNLSHAYPLLNLKAVENCTKLKRLHLKNCTIKNISFINKLSSLTELNFRNCDSKKPSLEHLFKHPTLQIVNATDNINSLWARKVEFLALDTKEDIKKLLQSEVLEEVKNGLNQLALYVELTSRDHENTTYDFFGLNKKELSETRLIAIGELDSLLMKFEKEIDTASLIKIIQTTLNHTIQDNFKATVRAIQILIDRNDIAGQNAVIEIFKKACEYYDPGHRYWEATVQDILIEDLFPAFEGEPLANLLLWCDGGYLDSVYGDGMEAIFKPAFEKLKNAELEDTVLNHFIKYAQEHKENLQESFLEGFENASPKVQTAINNLKRKFDGDAN